MRWMLVGADCEENLGMCMVSAAAAVHGHHTQVLPFDHVSQTDEVVRRILQTSPACLGLAIQFQHRGLEFLNLAVRLRRAGYRGHILCGGQFPTMAWRDVLDGDFGVDTVVLHEADHTIGELLNAMEQGRPLDTVAGIAYRGPDGKAVRTTGRPLVENLDELPMAQRYRAHTLHFGVPFIPIWGSRGCWGSCAYCSISTCYRDARKHGGGRLLRLRSPRSIATEMAVLWHAAGGAGIFCFHDENFLLPRPADSLARVREIRRWLDEFGVGKAALVGKCRPESLTPELVADLCELGLIRLYVGIENASQHSSDNLRRRTPVESLRRALDACQAGGVFACYNLLLFEPGATLDDIAQNVQFMRDYPTVPVNFCRAEPYHGTPLYENLRNRNALGGSFLGWDYRLEDDRAELLFRICSAVFRERNFEARGVTNRSMGLGYAVRVLEVFHEDKQGKRAELARRAVDLTRAMVLEKADLLDEAIDFARKVDLNDKDLIERHTALLGLRIAAGNRGWHQQLDRLLGDMAAFAGDAREPRIRRVPNRTLRQAMQAMAVVGSLSLGASACSGMVKTDKPVVSDGGADASTDATDDTTGPYDALPYDAGIDEPQAPDPLPPDGRPYDPLPYDSGMEDEPAVPDYVPQDASLDVGQHAMPEPMTGHPADMPGASAVAQAAPTERWVDTSPKRALRTRDLPLYQPPVISLHAVRTADGARVSIRGSHEPMGIRWEADGEIDGQDRTVAWRPSSDQDQIRVAVRTKGGVAIASLRWQDLAQRRG
jgi:anaerobic magnesium-protoporphyrin IX monomethyl ester cyclase